MNIDSWSLEFVSKEGDTHVLLIYLFPVDLAKQGHYKRPDEKLVEKDQYLSALTPVKKKKGQKYL